MMHWSKVISRFFFFFCSYFVWSTAISVALFLFLSLALVKQWYHYKNRAHRHFDMTIICYKQNKVIQKRTKKKVILCHKQTNSKHFWATNFESRTLGSHNLKSTFVRPKYGNNNESMAWKNMILFESFVRISISQFKQWEKVISNQMVLYVVNCRKTRCSLLCESERLRYQARSKFFFMGYHFDIEVFMDGIFISSPYQLQQTRVHFHLTKGKIHNKLLYAMNITDHDFFFRSFVFRRGRVRYIALIFRYFQYW